MTDVDGITNGVLVVNAGTDEERPATTAEQRAALYETMQGVLEAVSA